NLGPAAPLPQRLGADTELRRDLTDRLKLGLVVRQGLLEQPQRALPELRRVLTGHDPSSNRKRNQTQGDSAQAASRFASLIQIRDVDYSSQECFGKERFQDTSFRDWVRLEARARALRFK